MRFFAEHVQSPSTEPTDVASVTLRKVTCRLIPFLCLLYIVAWLDRVNVGFAALQMNADLGFSSAVFGFGSGVFFLGYCLFEVPSNLLLERVGARRWIPRIMVSWGAISVAMMLVRIPLTLFVLRFLLGAAEAGFFPCVVYSGTLRVTRARAREGARHVGEQYKTFTEIGGFVLTSVVTSGFFRSLDPHKTFICNA